MMESNSSIRSMSSQYCKLHDVKQNQNTGMTDSCDNYSAKC